MASFSLHSSMRLRPARQAAVVPNSRKMFFCQGWPPGSFTVTGVTAVPFTRAPSNGLSLKVARRRRNCAMFVVEGTRKSWYTQVGAPRGAA